LEPIETLQQVFPYEKLRPKRFKHKKTSVLHQAQKLMFSKWHEKRVQRWKHTRHDTGSFFAPGPKSGRQERRENITQGVS